MIFSNLLSVTFKALIYFPHQIFCHSEFSSNVAPAIQNDKFKILAPNCTLTFSCYHT